MDQNSGSVSTLAGGYASVTDGVGVLAGLSGPVGIAMDASGSILYFTDYIANRVRALTLAAVVTTIAGSGAAGFTNGAAMVAR